MQIVGGPESQGEANIGIGGDIVAPVGGAAEAGTSPGQPIETTIPVSTPAPEPEPVSTPEPAVSPDLSPEPPSGSLAPEGAVTAPTMEATGVGTPGAGEAVDTMLGSSDHAAAGMGLEAQIAGNPTRDAGNIAEVAAGDQADGQMGQEPVPAAPDAAAAITPETPDSIAESQVAPGVQTPPVVSAEGSIYPGSTPSTSTGENPTTTDPVINTTGFPLPGNGEGRAPEQYELSDGEREKISAAMGEFQNRMDLEMQKLLAVVRGVSFPVNSLPGSTEGETKTGESQ